MDPWQLIFSYLQPQERARVECCCKQWRFKLSSQDTWWKNQCQKDFSLNRLSGPKNETCVNFKEAYGCWYQLFKDLDPQIVRRACKMWSGLKTWLVQNGAEHIAASLNKGISKEDLESLENIYKTKFPDCVHAIYRIHNGQSGEKIRTGPIFMGLYGGYIFYDHGISSIMVEQTLELANNSSKFLESNFMMVGFGGSHARSKYVWVDCRSGDVVQKGVGKDDRFLANPSGGTGKKDGFLCWMEEYVNRLQNGIYRYSDQKVPNRSYQMINLFPRSIPFKSVAVTRGIQVEASVIFAPECSCQNLGFTRLVFSYSIRIRMVEENADFKKAQLLGRHSVIVNSEDEEPQHVEGPGVIGLYPIVSMEEEEFVYQSASHQSKDGGYMYGQFTFVEGTKFHPTGPEFQVECPKFELKIPDYFY
eukprot:TRINITY_DN2276_c0_g1_i2.p1 TRINITY_DN2276_c0_g1~~TRINITY_DN2276_c0_g1_i2.p1  ORF type:complete len:418 (-),score=33.97 TRINITY_DN2276_c0_g1_i2:395-1648(-)